MSADDLLAGRTANYPAGRQALDALYLRSLPALVAWCRLRVGGSPNVEAETEEIVQETWERALEFYPRFDPTRANFRSWVFGIAANVVHEWTRRRAHEREVPAADFEQRDGPAAGGLGGAIRDESIRGMMRWIHAQSPEDRSLLLQRLEERPLPQIARNLGISTEAAEKRWQRLCARLRTLPALAELFPD